MTGDAHEYAAHLIWDGNTGDGTATYAGYGRQYRVLVAGKPALAGSADAAFRGDADKHNPEDLFLAAISACHMLSYLALCARKRICVLAYEDDTRATMGHGCARRREVHRSRVATACGDSRCGEARACDAIA